ncbi:hypothetical protein APB26_32465 [Pseudomonas aeruginosa]|uniref:hypothetical protein n=1 Tax=Pseudomonas aeruginosa TaxID=287 RepID=UPI00071BD923|nr:hypothetical protein [Pseudomonas aeruginosa]KSQ21696.1 hypothetical protein APB26_32465 [Pseudomonas aeruginosa]RPV61368.1 hypothetical protein IPC838_18795 [Pseudomonas aeruginosa]
MDGVQGTAAVLQQTKLYEELVGARGEQAALGFIIDAFHHAQPNLQVTDEDIHGFMKVTRGLRTGAVNLPLVEEVGTDMVARAYELTRPYWDTIST